MSLHSIAPQAFTLWLSEFTATSTHDFRSIKPTHQVERPFECSSEINKKSHTKNKLLISIFDRSFSASLKNFKKCAKAIARSNQLDSNLLEKIQRATLILKTHIQTEDHSKALVKKIEKLNTGFIHDLFALELQLWINDSEVQGDKIEAGTRITQAFTQNEPELDLNGLSLTSLPECLGLCKDLTCLYLSENELESLPESIGDLSQLTSLHIFQNKLKYLPQSIGRLTNLKYLFAFQNLLIKLPESIGNLQNLTQLYVYDNHLREVPASFNDLKKLTHLSLQKNSLDLVPEAISELECLQVLDLGMNELSAIPPSFNRLANLKDLYLDENIQLTSLPIALGELRNLKSVSIRSTQIPQNDVIAIFPKEQNVKVSEGGEGLVNRLNRWKTIGLQTHLDFSFLQSFSLYERNQMNEWLFRLEKTKDFSSVQQASVAKIVCQILYDISKNEEFKAFFISHIISNNEHCSDRAAMALNEIYTTWRICFLPPNSTLKEKLGIMTKVSKTMALRDCLSRLIAQYEKKMKCDLSESVEIYLYYETLLRNSLGLESAIEGMKSSNFGICFWINLERLIAETEKNYLNHLIKFHLFESWVEEDLWFQNTWAPLEEEFYTKIQSETEKLEVLEAEAKQLKKKWFERKKKEAKADQVFQCQFRIGELNQQRQSARDKLAKQWYTNAINHPVEEGFSSLALH